MTGIIISAKRKIGSGTKVKTGCVTCRSVATYRYRHISSQPRIDWEDPSPYSNLANLAKELERSNAMKTSHFVRDVSRLVGAAMAMGRNFDTPFANLLIKLVSEVSNQELVSSLCNQPLLR